MARINHRASVWVPRAGAWMLLVLAVATATVGGWLVSIDGEGTCHVPHATCPREHDTLTAGAVLILVAAAMFVVAVVVWLTGRSRRAPDA